MFLGGELPLMERRMTDKHTQLKQQMSKQELDDLFRH